MYEDTVKRFRQIVNFQQAVFSGHVILYQITVITLGYHFI